MFGYHVCQAKHRLEEASGPSKDSTTTNLDLLDAETSLAQAQLAQVSAVYQCTLSSYQLDRATGMLPLGISNSR
jgi:outer membrane protein